MATISPQDKAAIAAINMKMRDLYAQLAALCSNTCLYQKNNGKTRYVLGLQRFDPIDDRGNKMLIISPMDGESPRLKKSIYRELEYGSGTTLRLHHPIAMLPPRAEIEQSIKDVTIWRPWQVGQSLAQSFENVESADALLVAPFGDRKMALDCLRSYHWAMTSLPLLLSNEWYGADKVFRSHTGKTPHAWLIAMGMRRRRLISPDQADAMLNVVAQNMEVAEGNRKQGLMPWFESQVQRKILKRDDLWEIVESLTQKGEWTSGDLTITLC